MKIFRTVIMIIFLCNVFDGSGFSQDRALYNPEADANADINEAIALAMKEGKHVLLQIGGNWCPWCIRLHDYYTTNQEVKAVLDDGYVIVLVNFSKENRNLEILERLEFPQRFGFPVLVILSAKGKRLHTQDTGLLESGGSYDSRKVISFLKNWTPTAVNSDSYND